ncbi:MAG: hypothetical protein VST64_11050, partial [Nitrospirota bacterium]|nr:hypothetical protein [Nitrospirota bacterium]
MPDHLGLGTGANSAHLVPEAGLVLVFFSHRIDNQCTKNNPASLRELFRLEQLSEFFGHFGGEEGLEDSCLRQQRR